MTRARLESCRLIVARSPGRWLVATCLLASMAASAQDYVRTLAPGKEDLCLAWNKREFTYHVHAAGSARTPADTEFAAIDAAFQTWQAVATSCSDFKFIRGPRIADAIVGKAAGSENQNILVFRETNCRDIVPDSDACVKDGGCGNKYNCWDHGDQTIGLTTTTFSFRTGIIFDADIEFNASPQGGREGFLFTTVSSPRCDESAQSTLCVATDVQNTVTHEIGHAIGLDHVGVPGSTMEPSAPVGETTKRIIDSGSSQGFCDTYPRGLPPTSCDEIAQLRGKVIARNTGTALFATSGCSTAAGALGLVAPALLLAFVAYGRRAFRGRR